MGCNPIDKPQINKFSIYGTDWIQSLRQVNILILQGEINSSAHCPLKIFPPPSTWEEQIGLDWLQGQHVTTQWAISGARLYPFMRWWGPAWMRLWWHLMGKWLWRHRVKNGNNVDFNTRAAPSPLGVAITEPSLNTLIAMRIAMSPTSG